MLAPVVPEHEMATLAAIPGLTEMVIEALSALNQSGWDGVVADDMAVVGSWGFGLEEISVPLSLWHGECDTLVPFGHSEYVASRVPGAVLHSCPGQGHYAMFGHQQDIFGGLTRHFARS
jgi:pimeloyl-ACP methyl ester carboxylesterase